MTYKQAAKAAIKQFCIDRNLSYAQLEKEVGFGQSKVSRWINDENRTPKFDVLYKIACHYDLNIIMIPKEGFTFVNPEEF